MSVFTDDDNFNLLNIHSPESWVYKFLIEKSGDKMPSSVESSKCEKGYSEEDEEVKVI
ncbi:hypothetical protein RO3G_06882 [Rhizopus delemar RA 99-880]|uniref:Uncharacterized protein n=1 Tax=Rhizopus delemar (strain RA 99-880 / ATCC MYA-4621 / FGSC 9543 / NRRL 43880) TaxID=246409 RepID=I1C147_RHIO9|nr:hypothetical protein RO3G_06882 [Rhizopus delemar RA 99-880]|eukprot:EIE82177.1 hypothetical protein RO3G_06882 [Rhizopus delemar RA 99-880]